QKTKMKTKKFFTLLLTAMLFAFAFAPSVSIVADVPVVAAAVAIAAITLVAYSFPRNTFAQGAQRNGVEVEIWANYIIDRFWKDNQFLKRTYSDNDYVLAGK